MIKVVGAVIIDGDDVIMGKRASTSKNFPAVEYLFNGVSNRLLP